MRQRHEAREKKADAREVEIEWLDLSEMTLEATWVVVFHSEQARKLEHLAGKEQFLLR